MASAGATDCRFVLDMPNCCPSSVAVDSTLWVYIPTMGDTESGDNKLDFASVWVAVQFLPEPSAPFVKYQIESIVSLLHVTVDQHRLRCAAELLDDVLPNELLVLSGLHPCMTDSGGNSNNNNNNNNNNNIYANHERDNYLESLVSTQFGLKSVLRDIDNVVNVKGKLNVLKNSIPNAIPVLPSAEEMRLAEHGQDGVECGFLGALPRPPPSPLYR